MVSFETGLDAADANAGASPALLCLAPGEVGSLFPWRDLNTVEDFIDLATSSFSNDFGSVLPCC